MRIDLKDRRYQRAEYQEFLSFKEADVFLGNYCDECRQKTTCGIKIELCQAIGDNLPFWDRHLVKKV